MENTEKKTTGSITWAVIIGLALFMGFGIYNAFDSYLGAKEAQNKYEETQAYRADRLANNPEYRIALYSDGLYHLEKMNYKGEYVDSILWTFDNLEDAEDRLYKKNNPKPEPTRVKIVE